MPLLRYNVAITLDGYIASPDGSTEWIIEDPSIDFDALYAQFDTFVMGRKTYEVMMHHAEQSGANPLRGKHVLVVSGTMAQDRHPDVEVVTKGYLDRLAEKRARPGGKDVWLMGGGRLAQECLDAGLLDTIEAAIMPVVIGDGVRMVLPSTSATGSKLVVENIERLSSGIIMTNYKVAHAAPATQHVSPTR
ncbi:bifunctional deaminase-reductase domain-containing protein [Plectosphaerella cucumerina]|jgi:dihydrofolate reductase|uniref:2,5-diamino-6-ribosylamino-4(3H)-pyrimidinone 5'-phosphate reductase n=1 Tax=Plectosphaerella cucumerina TaxID=40658 RepID=A0A8K0TPU1_9PEZI|nr:bifunctional deaminase-reductase domain-containing protein [Plectosphaerella cucumerina]